MTKILENAFVGKSNALAILSPELYSRKGGENIEQTDSFEFVAEKKLIALTFSKKH